MRHLYWSMRHLGWSIRHSCFALSWLVLITAASIALAAGANPALSVGVFSSRHPVACTLSSPSALSLDGVDLPSGATVTVRAKGDLLRVARSDGQAQDAVAQCTVSAAEPVRVAFPEARPRSYRGSITVSARDGYLVFVNHVALEDYLRGVVPAEMPAKFAPEALKAQAIAARTYTLVHLAKHQAQGYDLCDGVHCQVYLGAGCEDARVSAAVHDTAGLIVTYQGRPIQAVYHDACGGETSASEEAWQTKYATPYLRAVNDMEGMTPLCAGSPKAQWTRHLPQAKLTAALAKFGVIAPLALIRPLGCEDGTRPNAYHLTGPNGDWTVPAAAMRNEVNRVLGGDTLPSADFVAEIEGDTITLTGWGSGHGVGLCQWGANGLARLGKSATDILAHYYVGTQVQPLATAIAAK